MIVEKLEKLLEWGGVKRDAAFLAVSGAAFQSLFSNPLATPDTLGVATGASFGAALGILAGFSPAFVQLSAFASGIRHSQKFPS